MKKHWITKRLIRQYGGTVMPFKKLPIPAQAAMAWYMSVDGEAWRQPPNWKESIIDVLPWYRRNYGQERFGYVELPLKEVIDAVWDVGNELSDEFENVGDWIEWYRKHGNVPDHDPNQMWPVILSSSEDEFLQDGWHRLADYIRKELPTIPALYYPK